MQILNQAIKKSVEDDEAKRRANDVPWNYMGTPGYEAEWDEMEALAKEMVPLVRR